MKLKLLCFKKILKISSCFTQEDWHQVIAKIFYWGDFKTDYEDNLLSPVATSVHVFSAYAEWLDWATVVTKIQTHLLGGVAKGALSERIGRVIVAVIEAGERHIDWSVVSSMYAIYLLPFEFFEKYAHTLDWRAISRNACPETFLMQHAHRIDWDAVSMHQNLTAAFLVCYKGKFAPYY